VGLVAADSQNAIIGCEIISECAKAIKFLFRVNVFGRLQPFLLHTNQQVVMRVLRDLDCVVENGCDDLIGIFPELMSSCHSVVARHIGSFVQRFPFAFPDFQDRLVAICESAEQKVRLSFMADIMLY
jgi:hypothetical protein